MDEVKDDGAAELGHTEEAAAEAWRLLPEEVFH